MNRIEGETIREEIAIIGMACRFPGAPDIDTFWRNLCDGTISIGPFQRAELSAAGVDENTLGNPQFVNAGAAIEKADCFDAAFFDFSPVEAEIIDPQQRVLLECAWEALENAGYIPGSTKGRIGVFGGVSPNTYFQNVLMTRQDLFHQLGPQLIRLCNEKDHAMTRISFKLNLKGPSISVNTACSTSGVALHLACQSLLVGECDLALVGGARISAPLRGGYWYEKGGILSPDGHCRAFDAKANGTVFGDGVGMIVVKRLSEALEDSDTIYAVIKGTAINNDGDDKVGYAAPSIQGQATAIEEALAIAETHPDTIGYIETHGTGTLIGDPVEIAALTQAFRKWTDRRKFCPIGSVKSNIGHLFAAAGIAGIIKAVLALKHGQIPPAAGFDTANPQIDFENSSFFINEKLSEWPRHNGPRRAAVSSFGVGGTNFHAILEEAPESEPSGVSRDRQLLLISAKSNTALEHASSDLVDYLQCHPRLNLADTAYTLSCGRKAFDHRRMVVCQSIGDAATALKSMDPKRVITCAQTPVHRDIVFMFSGQGSQYVNMAKGLYRCEPVFKETVDYCVESLNPILGVDLEEIIYPSEENEAEAVRNLNNTLVTQPALFTIEYALANLWLAWGVTPAALVGHSVGEYVAACMAGVLSLEDALGLVATRARLMSALPGGQMTAVSLSEEKLKPLLGMDLSISAVNGPNLCVVSGKQDAVAELEKRLSTKDVVYRRLHTSHAFHSKMMEPIVDTFVEYGRRIRFKPAQTPIVSTVTGTWIAPDEMAQPTYWANNLRRPVRFWDCLQELLKEPDRIFLEVGPGTALSALTKMATAPTTGPVVLSTTRHPNESIDDLAFMLNAIGRIWVVGGQVQWSQFYQDQRRRRIALPTYPFERRRFWVKPQRNPNQKTANQTATVENKGIRHWFNRPVCKLRQMPIQSPAKAVFEHERPSLAFDDENQKANISGQAPEELLMQIWRRSLGMPNVQLDDDYFELGGNSLLAVSLFAQIEKAFQVKLPISVLYQAPTIRKLSPMLAKELEANPWRALVPIQTKGDAPPLFLVHGAGGNVLIYRALARHLAPDQPVYGVQARGLDGQVPALKSIEAMADSYLNEIVEVHPQGPYLLGGYCMGGTVAFEIAQRLWKRGESVKLLALLETYNFSNGVPRSFVGNAHFYLQKLNFHLQNFKMLDLNNKMKFLKEKANVAKDRKNVWVGLISAKLSRQPASSNGNTLSLYNLWKTNDEAAVNYVPQIYPGKISHFIPVRAYAHHTGPELMWDAIAQDGVETHVLPVYPAGMMVEPFVHQLAKTLKGSIRKALER